MAKKNVRKAKVPVTIDLFGAEKKLRKATDSEVDAYVFIKENLKLLGWDIRNPGRHPAGQVYTQTECHAHTAIKNAFNLDRPENVVKISETMYWVIEGKRSQKQWTKRLQKLRATPNL